MRASVLTGAHEAAANTGEAENSKMINNSRRMRWNPNGRLPQIDTGVTSAQTPKQLPSV